MGSTGFMITLSVLLIVGAVAGVVAQRRVGRTRRPAGRPGHPGRSGRPARPGRSGRSGASGSSGLSDLDAEAEANHWLIRLGGGLVPLGARAWAGADEAAGRALTSAAECHHAARDRLSGARTAGEYEEVTRVAKEGLEHLRSARAALGQPASAVHGPALPPAARVPVVGTACAVTSR
ncbi:hypothetical protein [Streptomyces sp. Root1310]|uniref:hypothetical protein n=1 Tax=Streptomyces sp. Root1310 TaxID=1736452 RepID=UPI00070D0CA1|nr:hypothetical protein [Streptomyces sp. Root1310]KQX62312.1 hypothetical protein ASD48_27230 [Streptomyces sp. Root1310]